MRAPVLLAAIALIALFFHANGARAESEGPKVTVGSKKFTESVILGEVLAGLASDAGAKALHRRELGGTRVVWDALLSGEIDAYAEYTGTIREEILGGNAPGDEDALRRELTSRGVAMGRSLGFNDTYAIGMTESVADHLQIRSISDLRGHPELKLGFGNEFMDRKDGWPGLAARYRLPQKDVRGLDHDLAYRGLEAGDIAAIDLYSTDAEIRFYGLRVLVDDQRYFPAYEAVLLTRLDLAERAPEALAAMQRLEGRIDEAAMIAMNARAKLDRVPEATVADDFLKTLGVARSEAIEGPAAAILRTTGEHLFLVSVSLLLAILLALPLGVIAAKRAALGQALLGSVGVLQTIPSLALLVVLIPWLGLGDAPAIVALTLYSLLPIVRSTHAGLCGIPISLRESAEALGLPARARLFRVELPIASRSILSGIKTAAVINVGVATLGALVGAGGYGQPILTGIRLNRFDLILQGAVPAALLALLAQGLFELAERKLLPRGLAVS